MCLNIFLSKYMFPMKSALFIKISKYIHALIIQFMDHIQRLYTSNTFISYFSIISDKKYMHQNHIFLTRNPEGKECSYRDCSIWNTWFVQLVRYRLGHLVINHYFPQRGRRYCQSYKISYCIKQRWKITIPCKSEKGNNVHLCLCAGFKEHILSWTGKRNKRACSKSGTHSYLMSIFTAAKN